jgi:hypothetical protein
MGELTDFELDVLRLANLYGDGLDLSGPRISRTVQAAARECIRKGLLSGKVKSLTITDAGKAAIPEPRP